MSAILLMLGAHHGEPEGGPGPPREPGPLARLAQNARQRLDEWRQARLDEATDRRLRTGPPLTADDLDAMPVGTRVTTAVDACATKISPRRWRVSMTAPISGAVPSQRLASDGVTALRVPLHPPPVLPWHAE